MIDGGDGVLPEQFFGGNLWAEIARAWPHVAVRELEPRPCEGVGKLIGMGEETPGNFFVGGVEAQGEVGGQHGWRVARGRVVGVRHAVGTCAAFGPPLVRASRALGQLPLVAEQVLEEVVAPPGRRGGPGDFQAAADGVSRFAAAKTAGPAQALRLDACRFRLRADQCRVARTVGLAKAVTARDQRHGLFVVHRHAGEGLANVARRRPWVWVAIGALRVHVDQAHLNRTQGGFKLAVAAVALVGQPLGFSAPVDVFFGFPNVCAPTGKTKGLEAHGFQSHVTREDHQVGPGEFATVLLLDRPDQAARLVQVHVVRPTIERRKALVAVACAAAPVTHAVGARAVPGHANEQRPIVAKVSRPPVL